MATLAQIVSYAKGVGPEKRFIISLDAAGNLDPSRATSFVRDAHAVGLQVHPYTFRSENVFYRRISGRPLIPTRCEMGLEKSRFS